MNGVSTLRFSTLVVCIEDGFLLYYCYQQAALFPITKREESFLQKGFRQLSLLLLTNMWW